MDFLSKLPGVTTKNIFALMNRLENMQDLLEQSLEDLTEILGHSSNAKDLYECLHENLCPPDEQQSANSRAKQKGSSRFKSEKSKAPHPVKKWTNSKLSNSLCQCLSSIWTFYIFYANEFVLQYANFSQLLMYKIRNVIIYNSRLQRTTYLKTLDKVLF